MSGKSKFFVLAGTGIAMIVILDFPYLWKNAEYRAIPPAISPNLPIADSVSREKTDPNTLYIPGLNLRAPIIYVTGSTEEIFQEALQAGVVHYPGTAVPGRPGNVYIFGHSSDFWWAKGNYKTVFALLPSIRPGAEIEVSDPEGNKFVYEVKSTKIVSPQDVQFLQQRDSGGSGLTLQTSYPLGTALRRFLVISELKN